jgi:hypothetical protein
VLTIPPKKRATSILQIQEVPSHGESRRNTHRNYYPEIGEKVLATPMLPKKWTQLQSLFCDLVSLEGASELMAPHPTSISASAMLLNLFWPPFTMSSPTPLAAAAAAAPSIHSDFYRLSSWTQNSKL